MSMIRRAPILVVIALMLCALMLISYMTTPRAGGGGARNHALTPEASASTSLPDKLPSYNVLKVAPVDYEPVGSLRSIDFGNFTYPGASYTGGNYEPEASYKLRRGSYGDWRYGWTLEEVSFGDVTGDGREEAMVNLDEESDGSGAQSRAYIFTLEKHRPKVIWAFLSGDRADGGLVRLYGKNGRLVVELFGRGTSIGGNLSDGDPDGLAKPKWITSTQYEWKGNAFERYGELEVFPNPAAQAACPTCYPRSEPREFGHPPRRKRDTATKRK
jgi:hypothetical protein